MAAHHAVLLDVYGWFGLHMRRQWRGLWNAACQATNRPPNDTMAAFLIMCTRAAHRLHAIGVRVRTYDLVVGAHAYIS